LHSKRGGGKTNSEFQKGCNTNIIKWKRKTKQKHLKRLSM